jgi:hypothetical protein
MEQKVADFLFCYKITEKEGIYVNSTVKVLQFLVKAAEKHEVDVEDVIAFLCQIDPSSPEFDWVQQALTHLEELNKTHTGPAKSDIPGAKKSL